MTGGEAYCLKDNILCGLCIVGHYVNAWFNNGLLMDLTAVKSLILLAAFVYQ